MKDPLGVSPSKRNQGTTRGKEKILLTSVGIEPTTSGLDLPYVPLHSHISFNFKDQLSFKPGTHSGTSGWDLSLSVYTLEN